MLLLVFLSFCKASRSRRFIYKELKASGSKQIFNLERIMKRLDKPAISAIEVSGLKSHACLSYARRALNLGGERCLMALVFSG
jgi:hypothetical protein